ncbi:hypothetical protein RvVAR0630_pl08880 (plasmid) [Agrobacterium vitis]|uniref:hypothetical protein n=1 Tax=Agrobacterium vitis TaxID=373 RepID=UPI0015DCF11E|nr:hypothetical protein [Agrobacterium vitis]BCH62746.1 hypothetical protein RvVAR0630_pl08880 [Agrobacterium vitis]
MRLDAVGQFGDASRGIDAPDISGTRNELGQRICRISGVRLVIVAVVAISTSTADAISVDAIVAFMTMLLLALILRGLTLMDDDGSGEGIRRSRSS